MARVSNCIISMINFMLLTLGLVALGTGIYIHVHGVSHCHKLLRNPLLIAGLFVTLMSLLGLFGSFCKDNYLLMIYLGMVFFLIVGLMVITVFAFWVTRTGSAAVSAKPGLGFKEYRLQDFSKWFQLHVVDKYHWIHFKTCLIDSQVCKSLGKINLNQKDPDFYKMKLTPLQSGCCKPPTSCNFQYKNATFWTLPATRSGKSTDTDCGIWSNKQEVLCYDCDSCKGGVLARLWIDCKIFAVYNIITITFLILTYFIGCCARRNIKYRYVNYSPYMST